MQQDESPMPLNDLLARNLDKLTRMITYVVLGAFIFFLFLMLLKAIFSFGQEGEELVGTEWLDLFKDGFLILGGVLTTLIGYYFGNRGSESALKQIEEVKKENERLLSSLDAMAPTIEEEDAGIEAFTIEP